MTELSRRRLLQWAAGGGAAVAAGTLGLPRLSGSDEAKRFLRRSFVFNNGFDEYGLLDSGSLFMAFSRDVVKRFEATKRNTLGQELDEYMVGIGGGYFFCPPGVRGAGDYLARGLVEG